MRPLQALVVLLLLVLFSPHRSLAQNTIPFPEAMANSLDAGSTFADRAGAVIRFNGCGRDADFYSLLQEINDGDFSHQGEELTGIVSAKIASWYGGNGCVYSAFVDCGGPCQPTPPPSLYNFKPPDCSTLNVGSGVRATGPAYYVDYVIPPDCLRKQINDALAAYKKHDQIGTSGLPCVPGVGTINPFKSGTGILTTNGEYDVNLREIVKALYLGSKVKNGSPNMALDEATRQHMISDLLIAKGPPGADDYSPIYDCGNREDSTGSAQDYADSQSWLDRAADSFGDAFDYLFKRWLMLLALYFMGPFNTVDLAVPFPAVGPVPPLAIPEAVAAEWILDPFSFARIPESENHRLMTESSRFLTNQEMISELQQNGGSNVDVVISQQAEVKDWLLTKMQKIAKQDFDEYNARPYGRYSLNAIQNLYDFSTDGDIQTAAHILLDFQTAKAAVGSNRARRYAPYRRRQEYDGYDPDNTQNANLYNKVTGADFEVVRMIVLAGQTQLAKQVPDNSPNHGSSPLDTGSIVDLVNPAVSTYQLPVPILELAVDRPGLYQKLHHVGVEVYSSQPGFLITGGGIHTAPANETYGIGSSTDEGVSLPIVVIPTDGGLTLDDLIKIRGFGGNGADRKDNVCMTDEFACGVNPEIPTFYDDCREPAVGYMPGLNNEGWVFINSSKCGKLPGNHYFYLALAAWQCPSLNALVDGSNTVCTFIEAIDAPTAKNPGDTTYDNFKNSRIHALVPDIGWSLSNPATRPPDWHSGTYTSMNNGKIEFTIPGINTDSGGVTSVHGSTVPALSSWSFAEGLEGSPVIPPISSAGDGLITIRSPKSGKTLTLDFRNKNSPKWSKSY